MSGITKSHFFEFVLFLFLGLLGMDINFASGEISSYSKLQYSTSSQQSVYDKHHHHDRHPHLRHKNQHSPYNVREQESWTSFLAAHVLNPDENPDYMRWTARDWRRWLMRRGNIEIPRGRNVQSQSQRTDKDYPLLKMRHTEAVIISNPVEVMSAFKGELLQYGTKNQALVWSVVPFQSFIFQKAGRRLRVFNCGQMYISGRLLNGIPVYLHDFYPTPIRNPLGGHLRYPISRHCKRLHEF